MSCNVLAICAFCISTPLSGPKEAMRLIAYAPPLRVPVLGGQSETKIYEGRACFSIPGSGFCSCAYLASAR